GDVAVPIRLLHDRKVFFDSTDGTLPRSMQLPDNLPVQKGLIRFPIPAVFRRKKAAQHLLWRLHVLPPKKKKDAVGAPFFQNKTYLVAFFSFLSIMSSTIWSRVT